MLRKRKVRRGATTVEAAFVYPILFIVLFGIIMLSIAVFRYEQVAHISREATRWASVRGAQYAKENFTTAATPEDVYTNAILPYAAGMPTESLTYSVTWNTDASGNPIKTPTSVVQVLDSVTGQLTPVPRGNTVTVRVSFTWNTGLFGTIPVSSTSVNIISY